MAKSINNMKDLEKALQPVLLGMVDELSERVYQTLNYFLDEYVGAGMYLILGILMIVLFWMAYQNVHVTKEYTILMVIFFGMLTTYFLPHMHERYLYLTDAFLLIYVMIRVKRFPLLMGASFLTVVGYAQYLTKKEPYLPYGVLAFVQLGISKLGILVLNSGYAGTWIYGILERALIPFGLHHVFYMPFWQTELGGSMIIDGNTVTGAQNIFFAELASKSTDVFSVSATRFIL